MKSINKLFAVIDGVMGNKLNQDRLDGAQKKTWYRAIKVVYVLSFLVVFIRVLFSPSYLCCGMPIASSIHHYFYFTIGFGRFTSKLLVLMIVLVFFQLIKRIYYYILFGVFDIQLVENTKNQKGDNDQFKAPF